MPYSSETKKLLKSVGIDIYTRAPTSPISLKKICEKIGLRYKLMPLDQNTCGMLVRSVKGPYIILNAEHPYTRRRFSEAHEIGHFMLGHDSDVSQANDQNRYEEVEANKYASCLLMPDELLYHVHKERRSIKEMAYWFRVSPISVAIRCSQFGIRQIEAEYVRSEYYQTLDDIASASERVRIMRQKEDERLKKRNELLKKELETRILKRNEAQRDHNQAMVDRWRRMYGYE